MNVVCNVDLLLDECLVDFPHTAGYG